MAETIIRLLLVLLAAFVLLAWWRRRSRQRLGLERGAIVAADDSAIHSPTLRSERLGLVGRCDHIVKVGRAYVPVEQKPSARRLYRSHLLQVGALCLLIDETYGRRPPYGIVVLASGRRERVDFTPDLERDVLQTMIEMRQILSSGVSPGPRWVAAKCQACGYHEVCWGETREH